jgi:hypothetical protein
MGYEMTGQELITELGNKGFTLFLSGGGVGYSYTGSGEPDRVMVVPVLEELRRKRDEVRGLLLSQDGVGSDLDQYSEVFRLALAEEAAQDPRGEAIRQIRQDSPQTWDRIQSAEDLVNELWKQAQGGRSVWSDYCGAVENWKRLFLQAIQEEKRLSRLAQERRSGRGKR